MQMEKNPLVCLVCQIVHKYPPPARAGAALASYGRRTNPDQDFQGGRMKTAAWIALYTLNLPQVVEANPPRQMDVAEERLL